MFCKPIHSIIRQTVGGIVLCCLLLLGNSSAAAQTLQLSPRPSWITKLPKAPKNAMYYYRVTTAEASTYQQAYAKAFATAILESAWKMGVGVDVSTSIEQLSQDLSASIDNIETRMKLPMNKVCEYSENSTTEMTIKIYILWQVAKYGNIPPDFDTFEDCR